jgi:hypothetical protein
LPTDAPNLSALLGKAVLTEKKAREILTGNYRRCNIVAHCLIAQGASLRQYISAGSDVPSLVLAQRFIGLDLKSSNDAATKITLKKETLQVIRHVLPIRQDIAYLFCFTGAETEIHKIKDDRKIIRQTNLDHHGLGPIPIVCHLHDHPSFSLPTTLKRKQKNLFPMFITV